MGNSPLEPVPNKFFGKMILFSSTNLGSLFQKTVKWSADFKSSGGCVSIYIVSIANSSATARWIADKNFNRIVIAGAGFYDCASHEDLITGGNLIRALAIPYEELDDEARAMVDCAKANPTAENRLASFRKNWIGKALIQFQRSADIEAVVNGSGLIPEMYEQMKGFILSVKNIKGIPVITPDIHPK